jgi:hypothetical protein
MNPRPTDEKSNSPPADDPPLIRLARDLHALLVRWDAACKARWQNQVRHGAYDQLTGDALQAEWDAMADVGECEAAIAATFFLMTRKAYELDPSAFKEHLREPVVEILVEELPAMLEILRGGLRVAA